MKFIDFHADTLYRLFYQENRELGDLWENSCHVSLEHLRRSGYTAQMFACFLNLAKKPRLGSHYPVSYTHLAVLQGKNLINTLTKGCSTGYTGMEKCILSARFMIIC